MPQGRVLVVLIVDLNPYERESAARVVRQRHPVAGAVAQRLDQSAVVGVAVRHDRIDARGFLDQIKRVLDPFVQHRVRAHLDPDEVSGRLRWPRNHSIRRQPGIGHS